MLFVPLPLFATLLLSLLALRFWRQREMALMPHRLFLAVLVLYAVQSLLLSLRWGYGLPLGVMTALIAPVLPVLAYLAYHALRAPLGRRDLWPLLLLPVNWLAVPLAGGDGAIILTYLVFGGLLLWRASQGTDGLTLPPLASGRQIILAMAGTGAALVLSGLVDVYVIIDFIRHDGRHIGAVVTVVQTLAIIAVGGAATFGRIAETAEVGAASDPLPDPAPVPASEEDRQIVNRIKALFTGERLHLDEDLSLRRLARRLCLPDRRVSQAINRETGQSVSQFVNTYRIATACALLRGTEDTVLDISLAAGFASKSNFNREFARITGVTPIQWRQGAGDPLPL
ncbi:helix-turn-helix domain-containing protein [Donghicola tyrosinivorans]|uniref:AraC-like DNA-binding protein n=1 Tax=Donghicola tyrosinivorans TaxID=1652492 RepID=A0A2T0WNI1_9RHOB|nr:AraC family transcriptional regulator [Donghicola tyrosinivorans]PRY88263.1 AraC-like DNA-binding protein [Donghicola tyrosinivorans]